MNFIDELKSRIKNNSTRIVFPEGTDSRIVSAAIILSKEKICKSILIGPEDTITQNAKDSDFDISKFSDTITIIDPSTSDKVDEYAKKYSSETAFPEAAAKVMIKKPLGFAAAMTRFGDADAYVGGAINRTSDVIQNCRQFIGMEEGIKTPSSFMIMHTPHFATKEGNAIVFADPGVNINPTSEQLADITIASARSTKRLLGWEPRVAMLSFSTKGSAKHKDADKVIEALNMVREREPNLLVDGEMQVDAALDKTVASIKIQGDTQVGGNANVLIFPDLDAANIAFKLVKIIGEAGAYGPFLQGFNKTASDLSRGCSVDDIIGVAIMAVLESQGRALL